MSRYTPNSKFSDKWSPEIQSFGFTEIPNLLIENQGAMDITPTEMCILISILKFQWDEKHPFPSIGRIATYIGRKPLTVTRAITSLEFKGHMNRIERPGRTNQYVISPKLTEKLSKLIRDKTLKEQKRQGVVIENDRTPTSNTTLKEYSTEENSLKSNKHSEEQTEGKGYLMAKQKAEEIKQRNLKKRQ